MGLRVAIQMDPIESINIDTDSTFVLALEAQKRGHEVYHYHPSALSLSGNRVLARGNRLQVRREKGNHFTLGPPDMPDLADFDIILMRQDPPFDMAYLSATYILEHLPPSVRVFNNPVEVRNAPEKLLVTYFPELTAPTLITADRAMIEEFRRAHKDIVIKPLYGNGGAGVFHLKSEDDNLGAMIEVHRALERSPLVIQKYLLAVRGGDKRIILFDGEPVGAVLRVPQAGEARANLHVGARAQKTELTNRDREICAAIGPELKRRGLVFTGIDVIGDFLTEINVTSPTGLQEINRFNGVCLEAQLWDVFEGTTGSR